jgi:predicted GNAT superfamily acetyltransferase
MSNPGPVIRPANASDHAAVVRVLNDWWDGRPVSDMLPRLFFVHFRDTTFIAERDGRLAGFLCGFFSQTFAAEAYIHFVGVHPGERKSGLGRSLYERFFEVCRGAGRSVVRCVTSPANKVSIAFHRRLGFQIEPGNGEVDGIPVTQDYDGMAGSRVLFTRLLAGPEDPAALVRRER